MGVRRGTLGLLVAVSLAVVVIAGATAGTSSWADWAKPVGAIPAQVDGSTKSGQREKGRAGSLVLGGPGSRLVYGRRAPAGADARHRRCRRRQRRSARGLPARALEGGGDPLRPHRQLGKRVGAVVRVSRQVVPDRRRATRGLPGWATSGCRSPRARRCRSLPERPLRPGAPPRRSPRSSTPPTRGPCR